jgi:hypothetical protein
MRICKNNILQSPPPIKILSEVTLQREIMDICAQPTRMLNTNIRVEISKKYRTLYKLIFDKSHNIHIKIANTRGFGSHSDSQNQKQKGASQ